MSAKVERRGAAIAAALILALIVVTMGLALSPSAESATVVDQQQTQMDNSFSLAIGGSSEQKLAQVVTAGVSGILTSVRFPVSCSSSDLVVQVRGVTDGVPNATIRTTTTAPAGSLTGAATDFKEIGFSSPLTLSAGERFALVLTSTGSCGIVPGPIGNPYGGGSGYYDSRPNPPGWVVQSERNDLPFQTVMSTGTVVDQQQPQIDTSVGGMAIGGPSEQKLAQVVTAGVSGYLTSVRFPVACSSGSLVVQVRGVTDGVPNATIRATTTASAESLAGRATDFKEIGFASPTSVFPGDRFALVLDSLGSCGIFSGPLGNPYTGGSGYYDARPNAPGWVVLGERNDLPFQTLVSDSAAASGPGTQPTSSSTSGSVSQPGPSTSPSQPQSSPTQPQPSPTASSPQPLPSTTTPPTPSPEPTVTPPLVSAGVMLTSSAGDLTFGQLFTLSGDVGANCEAGPTVQILRRLPGQVAFQLFTVSELESDGSFEEPLIARKIAAFKAVTPRCESDPVELRVRKRVFVETSSGSVPVGDNVKVFARLAPCRGHAGDPLSLFVDDGEGRFIFFDRKLTDDRCQATFTARVITDTYFLVKAPRTDDLLAKGISQATAVFAGDG